MECLDCGNQDIKNFTITHGKDESGRLIITDVKCNAQIGSQVCGSNFVLVEDEDNVAHLAASNEKAAPLEPLPQVPSCKQCQDTGFVQDAVTGSLKLCPLCQGLKPMSGSIAPQTESPILDSVENEEDVSIVDSDSGDEDDSEEEEEDESEE